MITRNKIEWYTSKQINVNECTLQGEDRAFCSKNVSVPICPVHFKGSYSPSFSKNICVPIRPVILLLLTAFF